MRIIRLEAENIKRLTAVDITPTGNLTIIAGRNGQGKTSTLDAIEYALGGKPGDSKPLREGEDGITFRGLPLSQASGAERLRVSVSVAMGLAANPTLKLLLIRDGSLLDADSLRMVGEMAEAAGADIWIERVGTGDAGAIVIEDGAVVEVAQ